MKTGVYPGSFDPITYGHIDIVKRALKVFDKLIVLVSTNPHKKTLFSKEERIDMIRHVLSGCMDHVEIETNNTLTVHRAKELGATHIVRGLRALTDFEYEFQMTHANRVLDKGIDSVFFMTDNRFSYLSSTTLKEIAQFNGDMETLAPPYVVEKIRAKYE